MCFRLLLSGFALLLGASAHAAQKAPAPAPIDASVGSPNGRLRFTLTIDGSGAPTYSIADSGVTLVQTSRLGLVLVGQPFGKSWDAALSLSGVQRRSVDAKWTPAWGERAEIPDRYNEAAFELHHAKGDRGPLHIVVRAYDEGVAFRYHFPENKRTQILELASERTEFNLPAGTQGFWTPAAQQTYSKLPLKDWKSDCEIPLTLELPGGRWLCIAEAEQTNYPRTRLRIAAENRLITQLYGEVIETSPFGSPWRVVFVADKPGQLLERNYLIYNLNPPCALQETNWIKPGRVMREVTLSTAGAKRLVDFAAEQGIDYIHFDAGWYGHEYDSTADARKVSLDPLRNPRGDFDLQEAIRYAKSKGRGVILYVNHRALERQADELFPLYRKWGVDGVKFGFVHTGSHRWVVWVHEAVKKAAENKLVVDIHDNYRPTGFSRTYPNLLQQEGILGDEGMPDATQSTIYPFTRFVAGAADHTYCWHDKRLKKTKAHQLALAAINFGPLQYLHWYDRPEMYADRAEIKFWKDLPTVWDDTRVLDGVPGQYIVTARRKGSDWWIGAVTNTEARTLPISYAFLPQGSQFIAEIYEDAPNKAVAKRTAEITNADSNEFVLKPSGGTAIRLRAKR